MSKLTGRFEIHWVRQQLVNCTGLAIINANVYRGKTEAISHVSVKKNRHVFKTNDSDDLERMWSCYVNSLWQTTTRLPQIHFAQNIRVIKHTWIDRSFSFNLRFWSHHSTRLMIHHSRYQCGMRTYFDETRVPAQRISIFFCFQVLRSRTVDVRVQSIFMHLI